MTRRDVLVYHPVLTSKKIEKFIRSFRVYGITRDYKGERDQKIFYLRMSCATQQEIADAGGIDKATDPPCNTGVIHDNPDNLVNLYAFPAEGDIDDTREHFGVSSTLRQSRALLEKTEKREFFKRARFFYGLLLSID